MAERLPSLPGHLKLSPEFKLVAACSWVAPPEFAKMQSATVRQLVHDNINWGEFLLLVKRHGVSSQAHSSLRTLGEDHVPTKVIQAFKQQRMANAARAILQETELFRLNQLISDKHIPMIPLKGILLSHRLYGDSSIRSSCDIDIMVKPQDMSVADQLLRDNGYQRIFPEKELSPQQLNFLCTVFHHFNYVQKSNGIHIELHWRASLLTPKQTTHLWEHLELAEKSGMKFSCLNHATELLYLCEHGAGHKWFRLKWLSDIAMLLAGAHSQDWTDLIKTARQSGLERILAQSALLVWWLYAVPLPEPLVELIGRERRTVKFAESAMELILMSEAEISLIGKRLESIRRIPYLIGIKPSLPYKIVIKKLLICHTDMKLLNLPENLFWLYLPLRPVLWFWRYFIRKDSVK